MSAADAVGDDLKIDGAGLIQKSIAQNVMIVVKDDADNDALLYNPFACIFAVRTIDNFS